MNLTLSDNAYTHIGHLLKEQYNKKYVRLQVKRELARRKR